MPLVFSEVSQCPVSKCVLWNLG